MRCALVAAAAGPRSPGAAAGRLADAARVGAAAVVTTATAAQPATRRQSVFPPCCLQMCHRAWAGASVPAPQDTVNARGGNRLSLNQRAIRGEGGSGVISCVSPATRVHSTMDSNQDVPWSAQSFPLNGR